MNGTWVYKCPICANMVALSIPVTEPPACSGKLRGDTIRRAHRVRRMELIQSPTTQKGQTMATKTETKKRPAKAPQNECQCNAEPQGDGTYGPCGRLTRGRFAPGHDAKLKGVLIRAIKEDGKYHIKGKRAQDPLKVAKAMGWESHMQRALDKAASSNGKKAAERPASKKAGKPKSSTKSLSELLP